MRRVQFGLIFVFVIIFTERGQLPLTAHDIPTGDWFLHSRGCHLSQMSAIAGYTFWSGRCFSFDYNVPQEKNYQNPSRLASEIAQYLGNANIVAHRGLFRRSVRHLLFRNLFSNEEPNFFAKSANCFT